MPPDDEEVLLDGSNVLMPVTDRPRARGRAIVLDPVEVVGNPEGTGFTHGGTGQHEEVIEMLTPKAEERPIEQYHLSTAEHRAEEDARDPGDWLSDLATAGHGLPTEEGIGAGRRTRRRATRVAEDVVSNPVDFLLGGANGVTGNWLDEMVGLAASHPHPTTPISRTGMHTEPEVPYEQMRDVVRRASHEAEERSPYGYGAGEIAGTLATIPLTPEIEGGTLAARLASAARTSGELGALEAAGRSEGEGDELLRDTAIGGAEAAAAGTLIHGGVEALGAGRRVLQRRLPGAIDRADRARVASVSPGSSISIADPVMRTWESMPGGIPGQAERLRRLDIVRPGATADDILQRSREVERQVGEESMAPVRSELRAREEAARARETELVESDDPDIRSQALAIRSLSMSPEEARAAAREMGVPIADLTDTLENYARELDRDPNNRQLANAIRARIEDYTAATESATPRPLDPRGGAEPTLPFSSPRRELGDEPVHSGESVYRGLADQTQWVDPVRGSVPLPTEVRRGSASRLRRTLDQHVGSQLGPERVEPFRQGRLDYQTALQAHEMAEDALNRGTRVRSGGLLEQLAEQRGQLGGASVGAALGGVPGAAIGGIAGSAASRFGTRAYRAREGALRATRAEFMRDLIHRGAAAELGPIGATLQRILQTRGPVAFEAYLGTLESSDPETSERIDELMDSVDQEDANGAVDLLSDPQDDGFLPSTDDGFIPSGAAPGQR